MEKITSRDNHKLKFIRKVRDGKIKEAIFVEGVRLAEEALKSNLTVIEALISSGFAENNRRRELIDKLLDRELSVSEVSESMFQSAADTSNAQGIILIAERPKISRAGIENNLQNAPGRLALVIFLHEINDPSNLGAILRTAEAAGVAGVIISKDSSDAFSPKALRAAMGASFRMPIWDKADSGEVLRWAGEHPLGLIAADCRASKTYIQIDWKKPRLLVFGSEAHGIGSHLREKIQELILIPMANNVESLNVAVACGIVLFESRRQNS